MSKADFWMALLGCFALCHAAPILPEDEALAQGYLSQFYPGAGSTDTSGLSLTDSNSPSKLQAMQEFFGLEVTGALNEETLALMKAPRCGVPDVQDYELSSTKWNKTHITYRVTEYTTKLTKYLVDGAIAKALSLYSDVVPLTFEPVSSDDADIKILFKAKEHGDSIPFDGPGGTLAHAFYPEDGRTHFDEDETWTLNPTGTNLLLVAIHEFGHTLGLRHSKDKAAIMFPYYQYMDTDGYRLPDDDKQGIQAIYGARDDELPRPSFFTDSGCCFVHHNEPIPLSLIEGIGYTQPYCHLRAVIVRTTNLEFHCVSHEAEWIRQAVEILSSGTD